MWEIGAEVDSNHADDVGDNHDGDNNDSNNDSDGSYTDDVPLARQKKKKLKQYKFETRRPFIPPQLPLFIPDPESPVPDDHRIPADYANMFIKDDMLENLGAESN